MGQILTDAARLINAPKWVLSNVFVATDHPVATVYNPTREYKLRGRYPLRLRVRGETGKWSLPRETFVTIIDGKIEGFINAADLRTPVENVHVTLTSSHINKAILARTAKTGEGVLKLDGVDDSAQIGGIKILNQSFSFTLWAKRERRDVEETLVSQKTNGLLIGFTKGNAFRFGFNNTSLDAPAGTDMDWHFWTGVFDFPTGEQGERRLYKDGEMVAREAFVAPYQGDGTLFIGVDPLLGGNRFQGLIDEVSVFNRVLQPGEILDIFANRGPSPFEIGLLGDWDFDKARGGTLFDRSPNGNNGTIVGATISQIGLPVPTDDAGNIFTLTDADGFYRFESLPLGNYNVKATKLEASNEHEFQKQIINTELILNGSNQLAIDFVDISVYPISGRIVYSIQKNGQDVFVPAVTIQAQPVGSTSTIRALPSNPSADATGSNYRLPLFAGKYLFLAQRQGHDIRIKGTHPNDSTNKPPNGYNVDTQLITIKIARTDIDFTDYTERKITVFVEDSGGFPIDTHDEERIEVEINGNNGFATGEVETSAETGLTFFTATLPPDVYVVKPANVPTSIVKGRAGDKEATVNVNASDGSVTMVVPVKIELEVGPVPTLLGLTETQMLVTRLDSSRFRWSITSCCMIPPETRATPTSRTQWR